jgi:hypothetical protein
MMATLQAEETVRWHLSPPRGQNRKALRCKWTQGTIARRDLSVANKFVSS